MLFILDQVCIATSHGQTKRCQIIDLVAEGVSEYLLDEGKLPIYVCEWLVCPYIINRNYGLEMQHVKLYVCATIHKVNA